MTETRGADLRYPLRLRCWACRAKLRPGHVIAALFCSAACAAPRRICTELADAPSSCVAIGPDGSRGWRPAFDSWEQANDAGPRPWAYEAYQCGGCYRYHHPS